MYYIQNVKENSFKPLVAWWKFNDRGYTSDVDFARVFPKSDVELMHSIEIGDKRAWPIDYIDGLNINPIKEEDLDIKMAWSST